MHSHDDSDFCLIDYSPKKIPYKRNAFGNHSKGIINLNLKLNYEKLFAFYGLYILIPKYGKYDLLLQEIN